MLKKIAEEEEGQITALLLSGLGNNIHNSELIDRSNKDLKKLKKLNRKKANLLKPKRQINRIFYSLFGSLLLIMGTILLKKYNIIIFSAPLERILICISIVFFVCGMMIIRQVAWIIIDTKQQLEISHDESKGTVEIKPLEFSPDDQQIKL